VHWPGEKAGPAGRCGNKEKPKLDASDRTVTIALKRGILDL